MGGWEVLLSWKGLPRHEATWGNYEQVQQLFLDFHLEGKDKLDDSAHKILSDYQTATVTLLSLISAAVGDVCDSSPYQIIDLAF
ncbi:E3 UFM1-protein ligase 1-like protein [Cucumis melo var. makuwa]|uniref:E3 UFM1-protein ligase 1-like protein n=1 Tax=Cucumis melo var. makuwa TaxID=1194695 RepID=A0A5A7SRQ4_CUCMM|nr:E3 UFM1-protein ligase 1-like protein [Cucumis melo var. makuwa]TYK01258.1 E3 UFM1-protein ligase 1-like protein [Cucumis melo var. makuwa]